jgi:hypothetical protein
MPTLLTRLAVFVPLASFSLSAAFAQAPGDRDGSLLEQQRRLEDLRAQRMETEVREALREAERVGRTDPAQAVAKLKAALINLEDDLALSQARRNELARTLTARIRHWNAESDRADRQSPDLSGRVARPTPIPQAQPGRPGSEDPRDRAAERIRQTNEIVGNGKSLNKQQGRAFSEASRDVARSASPPHESMDFPADWRERISRPTRQSVKMTAKEKAILEALQRPIAVDFDKVRLEEVIDYLEKATGLTIFLDKKALEDASASYDSPITMHARQASVRTVLRKVLGDVGLTYVVKDETIEVVTPTQAKEMLVARTYPVGDLIGLVDFRLGPVLTQVQMLQNIRQLLDLIQSTIEPASWEANGHGGSGTIVFYPATMSLIVKQSAEVHYKLGGILP